MTDTVAVGVDVRRPAVTERDGAAYLADGTLTGSTLTMDRAVRNSPGSSAPTGRIDDGRRSTPARILGLDTYGARGVGGRADLVALDRTERSGRRGVARRRAGLRSATVRPPALRARGLRSALMVAPASALRVRCGLRSP